MGALVLYLAIGGTLYFTVLDDLGGRSPLGFIACCAGWPLALIGAWMR